MNDVIKPMARQTETVAPPDAEAFTSRQLDLFRAFLCNGVVEHDRLSNAIDLWDSIPRYSVSRRAMDKARKAQGMLPLLKVDFHYKGSPFKAVIRPARIEQKDGTTKEYYPSANEELVEDALRKIAADQQSGFFDKPNYRSGVVFSLHMLREELKHRGHTRSYQEIVLSLDILSPQHHRHPHRRRQGNQGRSPSARSSPASPRSPASARARTRTPNGWCSSTRW